MKKYLLLLAAGAIALPGLAIADAHGYSQGVSGNVRINHLQTTAGDVTTAATNTGGGDTYLQWNHNYSDDAGKSVTGFVRFESSGDWRYNVTGSATEGDWTASAKAEWDANQDGGNAVDERDQFVQVSNASGLSIFFGRNAPFDSLKGNVLDYSGSLGAAVGYNAAAVDDLIDSRFNYIGAGYSMGNGVSVTLRLQMDNSANTANILGYNIDENATGVANTAGQTGYNYDISSNAVTVDYSMAAIDASLTVGSGSAETNKDRTATSDGAYLQADDTYSQELSLTKLGFNYDAGVAQVHVNYTATSLDEDTSATATTTTDYTGTNIGVSAAAGPGTVIFDLMNTAYTVGTADEQTGSATELGYLTSIGGASFKVIYGSGSYDDNDDTTNDDDSYLHMRLEYGF